MMALPRIRPLLIANLILSCVWFSRGEPVQILEVNRIGDAAPHNAFTDLVRFDNKWFCVFREGQAHVSPDGALRVITSNDGRRWKSAALIRNPTGDLRDPKITITPDDQ